MEPTYQLAKEASGMPIRGVVSYAVEIQLMSSVSHRLALSKLAVASDFFKLSITCICGIACQRGQSSDLLHGSKMSVDFHTCL